MIKDTTKQKTAHNTLKETNRTRSFWKNAGMGFLIEQLETHYGVRLTKEQKTGPIGVRLKREQLADVMIEM